MKINMIALAVTMAIGAGNAWSATGEIAGTPQIVDPLIGETLIDSTIIQNPDGAGAVAWVVQSQATGLREIRFQQLNENGDLLGSPQLVAGPLAGLSHPRLATGRYGHTWIAWQQEGGDGDGSAIMGRGYDSFGKVEVWPFVVNQTTIGDQQLPSVSTDEQGQYIYFAWDAPAAEGGHAVVASIVNTNGYPACVDCAEIRVNAVANPRPTNPQIVGTDNWGFDVYWTGPNNANPDFDRILQTAIYNDGSLDPAAPNVWGLNQLASGHIANFAIARVSKYGYNRFVGYDLGNNVYGADSPFGDDEMNGSAFQCNIKATAVASYDGFGVLMNCDTTYQRLPFVAIDRHFNYLESAPLLSDWLPPETIGQIEAQDMAMDAGGNALVTLALPDPSTGAIRLAIAHLRGIEEVPMSTGIIGPTTLMSGEPYEYTVWYSNDAQGAGPRTGLKGLSLTINSPAGTTPVQTDGYNWECSGTSTMQCRYLDVLDGGDSGYLRFLAHAPATPGPVVISATLGSSVNAIPTEAIATATIDITAPDQSPEAFSLPSLSPVAINTKFYSSFIVQGINQPTPISISNGRFSIGGGAYSANSTMVEQGEMISVEHTSANSYATNTDTILVIGDQSATFTSTTGPAGLTPDQFRFTDVSGVQLNAQVYSSPVVIAGITEPVVIAIVNGSYAVDGGAFQSTSSMLPPGSTVQVQHTAASGFLQTTDTILTIGGISDTFSSTTEAMDATPVQFSWSDVQGAQRGSLVTSPQMIPQSFNTPVSIQVQNGSYAINDGPFTAAAGTIHPGDRVRVQHVAASSFYTATTSTLTIGTVSGTFRSYTEARDDFPSLPYQPTRTGVPRNSEQISDPIVISGINDTVAIVPSNGSYSINGGPFSWVAGQVAPGDTVRIAQTAATGFSQTKSTSLTVGSGITFFVTQTEAQDTTPNAFTFGAQGNVAPNTIVTSDAIVVAGINAPAPISIVGGTYAINGGAFVATSGTIAAGDSVQVRHTSASAFSTNTDTVLTIGGVSATFRSTTEVADSIPMAFSFAAQTGLATNVMATSQAITVAGINTSSPISITNGSYAINGGTFVTTAGTVNAGDQIQVRVTTAAAANTAVLANLTIGGVSAIFTATTGNADTTPNAFVFTDVAGARRGKAVTSNTVTVSGINASVAITVSGAGVKYSKNGGAFTTAAGTLVNGDQIRLQLTASASANTTVNATATIGGISDTWSVTTGTR